ncbi:hypothetical protein M5689_010316 [Euphorbia peplus]|nr:hypothetical protein M5689_010316 [Euphorbia peplus]
MATEIENMCKSLTLNDEEEVVVEIDEDQQTPDESLRWKVITRLMSTEPVNLRFMENVFTSIWKANKGFKATKCDHGNFMIEFESERDKVRVLDDGPWYYDRHLIILADLMDIDDISEIDLNLCPFWVQINNLPLSCKNKETIYIIAGRVGKVIYIDEENIQNWASSIRV